MKRLLPVLMGFIISCTFHVTHADELVFSDEHWGKPKNVKEVPDGCGLRTFKTWSGQKGIWVARIMIGQSSLSCHLKDLGVYPKKLTQRLFNETVTMDNWGKTIKIDTGYFNFLYRKLDFTFKNKSRKCFAFGTEAINAIPNSRFLISGVYCGQDQSEGGFKKILKTIRLDIQKPLETTTVTPKKPPPKVTNSTRTPSTKSEPTSPPASNIEEKLQTLQKLEEKGLITKGEATKKRQAILDSL